MKALNSSQVTEIDFYTVFLAPRSFGADTSLAALGTILPASLVRSPGQATGQAAGSES